MKGFKGKSRLTGEEVSGKGGEGRVRRTVMENAHVRDGDAKPGQGKGPAQGPTARQ